MSENADQVAEGHAEQRRQQLAERLRNKARQQPKRFPLSFGQQRLWFLDELEGGSTIAYLIPVVLRLHGRLEPEVIERSFTEIIRRHESLRTTFELSPTTGAAEQVVHYSRPFQLEIVDLGDTLESERLGRARQLANREARRPFDLNHGPLLRASLLTFSVDDHVLLLTIHHIVSDGWSVGVLIRELITLYEAFLHGQRSPLAPLPIQYADFAHWQRQRLQGEVLENQLVYWRKQLAGHLPVLDLPTRGPRPLRHTDDGAVRVWSLPADLCEGVKVLSQREGTTLFMTLLAAFNVLLYRYTHQTDLLVGTPIANRNRTEVEPLIGLFINTVILRTDLSDDPPFKDLLVRVREAALGAYAHQEVPFEKLVEELQPQRDLSRTPFFQVMFVMQNNPMPVLKMADVTIEPLVIEGATSKFDLTLSIMEEPDGNLSGWLEYNSNLFDEPMIDRMIGHYNTLLGGLIADPDQRASCLPILTGAEHNQLLVEFNDTAFDYSLDCCVHELFEAQARRTPGATALIFEDQELTYEELNHRSEQLASYLQGAGVGPDVLVGISMDRSADMIVAILGVLKAGGAYVPLDPTYPQDRLAFMADDAGLRNILTQSHLAANLGNLEATLLCLDTQWATVVEGSARHGRTERGATPFSLAYVIYTSGSTGRPKGVMTPHRAVANMILWMQAAYQMSPEDRLLQKTSFSFDASAWEFFWPLITGATLVVARPYAEKDGAYMVETLQERRITYLQLVPSLLGLLVEQEGFDRCEALKHVFCGGEALPASVCERFFERLPGTRLTNVYGPTETTMHVTVYECHKGAEERIMPIGWPVGNTQAYIVDDHMQLTPVMVAGELLIGGAQVARGYLNRTELTEERFIADPYSNQVDGKLYRTGDLARFRSNGSIEFLGRIDHQVKVRGYRIELGEIESVLRQQAAISDAIVIAREDTPGDKRLVAYVTAKSAHHIKIGELRSHILEKLPEYMLPTAFVLLEQLPLLSNGKVNRQALPPPEHSRQQLEQEYVAPRNDTEAAVAGIFAEVLRLDQVGVEDNFFLLGGHSLSATQVIGRMRDLLQANVPLRRMFETPTVAGLALAVEQSARQPKEEPIAALPRDRDEAAEPLSTLIDQLSQDDLQALLQEIAARKKA